MKKNIYNKINSTIHELALLMRGNMDSLHIGEVVYLFFFLRRIDSILVPIQDKMMNFYRKNSDVLPVDEMDAKLKVITGCNFYNVSGLTLSKVVSGNEGTLSLLQNYFNGFNQDVKEILSNLDYMNVVDKLNFTHILQQSLALFLGIDMSAVELSDNEIWRVYAFINDSLSSDDSRLNSRIMGRLSSSSRLSLIESNTSMELSELMSQMLFAPDKEEISKRKGLCSVYDQTCGMGTLIFTAASNISKIVDGKSCHPSLYGQDINLQALAKTRAIAFLSGYNWKNFKQADVLYSDNFDHDRFDYILSNFPFGYKWNGNVVQLTDHKYHLGLPSPHDATILFIQDIISKMKDTSRACFVTTELALTGGGFGSGENSVRKYLIDNDMVDCIVALQSQSVFRSTTVPIYMWILTRKKKEFRVGTTQFIDARNIFSKLDNWNSLNQNEVQEIVRLYQKFEENDLSHIVKNQNLGELQLTIEQPIHFEEHTLFNGKEIDADKKQNRMSDKKKEFTEVIPLDVDVNRYFDEEILPNIDPNSWIDYSKTLIGYRFDFKKIFAKPISITSLRIAEAALLLCQERVASLIKAIKESDKDLSMNNTDYLDTKLKYTASIRRGVTSFRTPPVKKGDAYLIQAKDIINGFVDFDDCIQLSKDSLEKYSKYELKDGDILLSSFRQSGKIFLFEGANKPVIAASSLFIIRANEGVGKLKVDERYMYTILSSSQLNDYISSNINGYSFMSLSIKELGEFSFKLPDLERQRQIVQSLIRYDGLLQDYEIALAEEQKALKTYRKALLNNVLK